MRRMWLRREVVVAGLPPLVEPSECSCFDIGMSETKSLRAIASQASNF